MITSLFISFYSYVVQKDRRFGGFPPIISNSDVDGERYTNVSLPKTKEESYLKMKRVNEVKLFFLSL